MRPATKVGVIALVAALGLSGCASVPEGAIDSEAFAPSTINDPKIPIGPGSTLAVESFEWGFTLTGTAVDGPVTVQFSNIGGTTHNFRIDNAAGEVKEVEADPGASADGELLLFGGSEYTYYCSIPGHRAQGMEGTLQVALPGDPVEEPTEAGSEAVTEAPSEAATESPEPSEPATASETEPSSTPTS